MVFIHPISAYSNLIPSDGGAGFYNEPLHLSSPSNVQGTVLKRKGEGLGDDFEAMKKKSCRDTSFSKEAKDDEDSVNKVLPRGWLQPEWLYKYSRAKDSNGKEIVTTNVLDSPDLFLWLKENKFPSLTISQYRTSVRRLVDDMGPGYNNNKIDGDVTKVLRKRIAEYGKKYWGFQKVLKLRNVVKKDSRSSSGGKMGKLGDEKVKRQALAWKTGAKSVYEGQFCLTSTPNTDCNVYLSTPAKREIAAPFPEREKVFWPNPYEGSLPSVHYGYQQPYFRDFGLQSYEVGTFLPRLNGPSANGGFVASAYY